MYECKSLAAGSRLPRSGHEFFLLFCTFSNILNNFFKQAVGPGVLQQLFYFGDCSIRVFCECVLSKILSFAISLDALTVVKCVFIVL